MESRVAIIGIIVENMEATERLNAILHEYAPYVIGRMGIPYREKKVSIISVAVDAPEEPYQRLSRKNRTFGRRQRQNRLFQFLHKRRR